MKKLLIVCALLAAFSAEAQKKKKQDVEAIKAMCGCYKITFNYSETFAPDKEYEFHDNYKAGALEYVTAIEESKDKIVLQHLLVISDSMIIKHWRQDWLYENTDFFTYYKDNSWNYKTLDAAKVKGQWTQKVYQVDDGPRYEGSASWVHVDGKHYWENTTDSPLPRREFSKRSDYNVMKRGNRHEILSEGWIHEQDNDKIVREESGDVLLAQEKGMNTYTKVDESQCDPAKKWWTTNQQYWAAVRTVWSELYGKKKDISFDMKKDGKVLFQRLFALGDEQFENSYAPDELKNKIKDVIQFHLKGEVSLASR